ncbi:hypothetical protein MBLNU230_g7645t1 [Neophaeotheca triangularis]
MGWLWGSKSEDTTTTDASAREASSNPRMPEASKGNFSLTEEQRLRIFGKPGPDSGNSSSSSTPPATTRDEQADAELNAFLASLDNPNNANTTQSTTTTTPSTTTTTTPTPQTPSTSIPPTNPDGTPSIHPQTLYPRELSCRQLFDQAFYCQSLGGKFNDIYRFGTLQACNEHWSAFWFCMRARSLDKGERERQVVEFYRDRDERRRKQWGSSEDVWPLRERMVERAFWRDPDVEEGGEREWTVGRGEEV